MDILFLKIDRHLWYKNCVALCASGLEYQNGCFSVYYIFSSRGNHHHHFVTTQEDKNFSLSRRKRMMRTTTTWKQHFGFAFSLNGTLHRARDIATKMEIIWKWLQKGNVFHAQRYLCAHIDTPPHMVNREGSHRRQKMYDDHLHLLHTWILCMPDAWHSTPPKNKKTLLSKRKTLLRETCLCWYPLLLLFYFWEW